VTYFSGVSIVSMEEVALTYDATSDTGSQSHAKEIPGILARAKPVLTVGDDIGIVVKGCRNSPELIAHDPCERYRSPSREIDR
jgi:hypothetical protein